jgi:DNA-binding transcriptional LysR family regulator
MFASFGIVPRRLMELGSTQSIKETVEAGLGVTLQSVLCLRKELELGTLKLLDLPGLPVRRSFHVLFRQGDLRTRTMEVFCAIILGRPIPTKFS